MIFMRQRELKVALGAQELSSMITCWEDYYKELYRQYREMEDD